ncbi:TRK-1 protein [Aphelenchoides avenae]|nr:TRK-1 protein [Aphelenchus avenae]
MNHDRIIYDDSLDKCTFDQCLDGTVQFEENEVNTTLGTNTELRCSLSNYQPTPTSNASTPAISTFRWLLEKDFTVESEEETMNATRRNYTFTATRSGGMAVMQLAPVASEDLGLVACICDECLGPEFDLAEIRFLANLTAELHDGDREAVLIVHGYPLGQVEMAIRRVSDNATEKHVLSNEKTSFFDDTLSVEFEKGHSQYFLKYYSIFIHECSDCHHIHLDGHYEITLCSEDSCVSVNNTFHNANYAEKITRIHVDNRTSTTSSGLLHAFPIIILFLMVTAITMGLLALRFKRRLAKAGWEIKHRRISRYTERTDETSIRLSNMDSMDTFSTSASSYMIQHVPVIESDQIELKEKIGKGAFGEVFVADWREKGIKVAVKMLHNVQMDAEMDKEAALLAQMEHENVVKLFGIWRCDNQLTLVLEMMSLGDLKNYLRQRKPSHNDYCQFPPSLLETELINICIQICSGLCYIASQQIVHRDLASRNCLVTGESDLKACSAAFRPPVTVKISDFGMSRKLYPDVEYYRMQDKRTALPVRWLPPECLSTGKFTHQSDIWSFGVTLSEVFSYGEMPFGNLSNSEVLSAVMSGMRPSIPSKCPFEICQIIADCWHESPTQRLNADEALTRLKMIQNH